MHIGLDLDNTVLDATTAHLKCYNKISGRSLTNEDATDFHLYRLYGWDHEQRDQAYYQHGHDIHWNSDPYSGAVETIQSLFRQHQISVITARPKIFQEVTIQWLEHHHIPYHHIVFTENKLLECEALNVDVLVDDGPHYAREFAERQKPVIMFLHPYNIHIHDRLVYRVSHWSEVKDVIASIQIKTTERS